MPRRERRRKGEEAIAPQSVLRRPSGWIGVGCVIGIDGGGGLVEDGGMCGLRMVVRLLEHKGEEAGGRWQGDRTRKGHPASGRWRLEFEETGVVREGCWGRL